MAPVNPSIALGVRPVEIQQRDPLQEYAQVMSIQNAQIQNQLARQQMEQEQGVMNYLRAPNNLTTPEGRAGLRQFGKTGLAYEKLLADQEMNALKRQELEGKLRDQRMTALGTGLTSVLADPSDTNLAAAFDRLDATGVDTKPFRQQFANMPDLTQRKAAITQYVTSNPEGRQALAFVQPKPGKFDLNGKIVVLDENPNSPTYMQPIKEFGKGVAPGEAERINLDRERVKLEQRRVNLAEEEAKLKREGIEGLSPKELQKRNAALPQAKSSVESFETKTDQFIKDLEKLRDDPGLNQITGPIYGRTPSASREGSRAQSTYNKIFAKGGFQGLQDLREASKTGGALGNVSNEEGRRLEASVVGGLDRTQHIDDVKAGINALIEDLKVSKARVRNTFDDTYSYKADRRGAGPTAPSSAKSVAPAATLPPGFKLDK